LFQKKKKILLGLNLVQLLFIFSTFSMVIIFLKLFLYVFFSSINHSHEITLIVVCPEIHFILHGNITLIVVCPEIHFILHEK